MGFVSLFRLFRECFQIAGDVGLIACAKYLSGAMKLPEINPKCSEFLDGDFYV